MSLDIAALPLAFVAGVAGIVSPCVWPLVPVVVSSAALGGKFGPYALAAGLSLSFAFAGTLLTFVLVNAGMDPELFRRIAAGVLVAAGVVLVVRPLGECVAARLSLGSPGRNGCPALARVPRKRDLGTASSASVRCSESSGSPALGPRWARR